MVELLAKDGTADNQRQGRLGRLLHDFSKWAIRKAITRERKRLDPVLKYKKEHGGWLNPDIQALYDDFTWVISRDELKTQYMGFNGPDDANKKMLEDLRDIVCCHLDEDSHWHLRWAMLLYRINHRWSEYEIECTKAYHFLSVTAEKLGLTMEDMYKSLENLENMVEKEKGEDLNVMV
jgi:hypothetical protein